MTACEAGDAEMEKSGVTGGFTVISTEVLPVDPPKPPEIEAPYIVTVVVLVTEGAVQLNAQLSGAAVSGAMWVISPFNSRVVDPAIKVPCVAATSRPLFAVPELVRV